MRVQLSFEFLLYVGIAMASMAAMLGLYLKGSGPISSYSAQAEMEDFVANINSNMAVQHGSFYAYLPKGMCNALAKGRAITYMNQTYPFYGNVSLQLGGTCANTGVTLVTTELLSNGTLLAS